MVLNMLLHMPWYHYALMAGGVVVLDVILHRLVRRTYWPQHESMQAVTRNAVEHMVILLIGVVVMVTAVSGGMLVHRLM